MIIKKEEMFMVLVNQQELDAIADCIRATITEMEDDSAPDPDYTYIKQLEQMLEIFRPLTKVLV